MLTLFNTLTAEIIALAWLCIALTFPILAVWFGVRVARDLRRIAESLQDGSLTVNVCDVSPTVHVPEAPDRYQGRVSNSALGR